MYIQYYALKTSDSDYHTLLVSCGTMSCWGEYSREPPGVEVILIWDFEAYVHISINNIVHNLCG